jgi:two-component system chemotaxis sensor kinase CheA
MRNAVDHGLEPPSERENAGKPAEGVLRWTTAVNGRTLSLCIEDDGRGVAEEALVQRAIELCLVRPEVAARMDTAQRLDLVFAHGLSSRSEVNAISGRGIGLSAVRAALQALNGNISLFSRPGHGCVFQIELPLVEPEYVAQHAGPETKAPA